MSAAPRQSVDVSASSDPGVEPIRVLLADDHRMVRAGLAALLETADGIRVVGQATDGHQAVQLALRLRPDVVLMDLSMPILDGLEATRQILSVLPATRILVLTAFGAGYRVQEALRAGAVAYLVKDCNPPTVVEAVQAAADRGLAPCLGR